jgi:hypothetical protein
MSAQQPSDFLPFITACIHNGLKLHRFQTIEVCKYNCSKTLNLFDFLESNQKSKGKKIREVLKLRGNYKESGD